MVRHNLVVNLWCIYYVYTCPLLQHITGIPPEGLTAEEIEKMRKKFGVSFKFSKFVLDDRPGVRVGMALKLD